MPSAHCQWFRNRPQLRIHVQDTVSELKRIAELVEQASSHVEQLDMRLDAMQAQQTLQWAISSADQVR